jgi:nucleotide-binding universal stress UspA family protein
MNIVKKLLVPIDFSPQSAKALRYAFSLAGEIDAEIIALHVVEDTIEDEGLLPFIFPPECWPFFDVLGPARPLDVLLRERALDLWHFIDQTVHDKSGVRIRRMVRLGKVRKEIAAAAREENIDLVVFELRKRFVFPGLATRKLFKMIEKLPYPVLLTPPLGEDTPSRGKPVLAFHLIASENPA